MRKGYFAVPFSIVLVMALFIALLTSREREKCERPEAGWLFEIGERALFVTTGETVRIVGRWETFAGPCHGRLTGEYTIHFYDGSKATTVWEKLRPIN